MTTHIDFTEAELRQFSPRMQAFYRDGLIKGKEVLRAAGILANGKRLAHFLGQFAAETGGGTILRESLTYTTTRRIREVWPARARKETEASLRKLVRNPVALGDWAYGGRMGNRKGTPDRPNSDGYDYRGGGYLQTTGRSAVETYCRLCAVAIRPDILDDPDATLKFACAEWQHSGCNELADANDLLGISKAINTGSATSGAYPNGMEHREAWFRKAQAIWWDAVPEAEPAPAPQPEAIPEPAAPVPDLVHEPETPPTATTPVAFATASMDSAERAFAWVNRLADLGSRAAMGIRSFKQWVWKLITAALTTIGVALGLIDPSQGNGAVVASNPRALWFVLGLVAGAIVAGVAAYLFVKFRIEPGFVSAAREGRYRPRGA